MIFQPSASIEILKKRAELINNIRDFFRARNIWEVTTPILSHATVTDPYLHSLKTMGCGEVFYLQTSPEYAMKRLLAAGSGDIYQITPAFRNDEQGRYHNLEFTMLEWYRINFTHHDLMQEMDDFLQFILQCKKAVRFSYQEIFKQYLNINPHNIALEKLIKIAQDYHLPEGLGRDDYLQLLLDSIIEKISENKLSPIFIYNYPVSQAALAKITQTHPPVAERFEVYYQGIELANGYHELTDAETQRQRFDKDLARRKHLGYEDIPIDMRLLAALEKGLPDCAGVALGIDRLIMIALGQENISQVLSFDASIA